MKKLNKRGKAAAALVVSAGLLFAGCQAEKAAPENKTAASLYTDEYVYELFRINLINDKNEVFAAAIEANKDGGLYLDNNRNNFKIGDIIKAVYDNEGEFITALKAVGKKIQLMKIDENEKGQYYYDKTAEYEKTILVSKEDVKKWNLENIKDGEIVTGLFDLEGWQLNRIIKEAGAL